MIEGFRFRPLMPPQLSDPPIGPRPRHFVRLAHGMNVRGPGILSKTLAPCLDCRRDLFLGEIACGNAEECDLQWQSQRHG